MDKILDFIEFMLFILVSLLCLTATITGLLLLIRAIIYLLGGAS